MDAKHRDLFRVPITYLHCIKVSKLLPASNGILECFEALAAENWVDIAFDQTFVKCILPRDIKFQANLSRSMECHLGTGVTAACQEVANTKHTKDGLGLGLQMQFQPTRGVQCPRRQVIVTSRQPLAMGETPVTSPMICWSYTRLIQYELTHNSANDVLSARRMTWS